ncbi:MAG: glutamine-hydrolyzing GMP synthase [Candidatus Kariarchaeaceae archaeon]
MIIVLDFGSQLAHLIAKKIRMLGEYSEIHPSTTTADQIRALNPEGIILSGGPSSVYADNAPRIDPEILSLGIPVLGICYGFQLIAYLRGGTVEKGEKSEYGVTSMKIIQKHPLLAGLKEEEKVLMSHGDRVTNLPEGGFFIAETEGAKAAFADDNNKLYGIQFHAEVEHTPKGMVIFENFLKISGARREWSSSSFITEKVEELKRIDSPVLMAVSGGVDSTIAAALIEKAAAEYLHCVFVDNGLLRKEEAQGVVKNYEKMFKHFHFVDAKELFFSGLKGVSDPEEKRKIIGRTFVEVFEEKAKELEKEFGTFEFLGQGTIYPDRVESAATSINASVIKSHHNVGGLPEHMNLTLVEPLDELYKFEVRLIGKEMGIDDKMIERHPFPGPGLAVRCLGEVTPERVAVLQEADTILTTYLEEDPRVDFSDLWQAFFVLLPVKTVGVMGDERTYENAGVIRIVESTDAMTANVADIPFDLLITITNEIVNKVKGINRVCYDLTGKPPGTIEWE